MYLKLAKSILSVAFICSLFVCVHLTSKIQPTFFPFFFHFQHIANTEGSMCADADLRAARDACCYHPNANSPQAYSKCYYSYERTTFQTAKDRCDDNLCPWHGIYRAGNRMCQYSSEDAWYWTTNDTCSLQVKG